MAFENLKALRGIIPATSRRVAELHEHIHSGAFCCVAHYENGKMVGACERCAKCHQWIPWDGWKSACLAPDVAVVGQPPQAV